MYSTKFCKKLLQMVKFRPLITRLLRIILSLTNYNIIFHFFKLIDLKGDIFVCEEYETVV